MKPLLAIRGLAKSYGAVAALRGVDLDVGEREFLVVLGATGSGKTTLLRSIAGLLAPDAGTIELGGRAANALSPAERDIAYVFQNFSLYPSMTVRENLAFPLRAPGRRLEPAVVDERVARAAGLLRIERLLERPARRLSGGEMQRVAIGRAIVREPRLFLMDEPLSNLDAKLREELRVELAGLARELGAPVVWVTHDHAEALSLADRVAVLGDGRILQSGTPREVYERPADARVGRLVGFPPINVLAVAARDGWWSTDSGARIAPCAPDVPGGARAELGVRPEHVALTGGDGGARVKAVEALGPAALVVLDWCGSEVRALVEAGGPQRAGDSVAPRVDAALACVWRNQPL
ncbi:MAG: ABC transporter ATP-binding protein [Planctomycetes bacterium]|nr:ABC transporter ATP-binding protein [Planctomycetota bacterium]